MKTTRVLGLLACVLLLSGPADARVVTVRDTLDYTHDGDVLFFLPPNVIMDHPPFYRMSLEDWDWVHSMKDKVPADANGIQSATLSVYAWDVDGEEGEVDIIYANGVRLGTLEGMPPGQERVWTTTVFSLPAGVLQELWRDGQVTIFMDIDHDVVGDRVAIGSSTLTVNYTGTGQGVVEPNVAVYRFWSPVLSGHFYTISEDEKNNLIAQYPDVWTYEGVAYHTFGAPLNGNLKPVYRFWSGQAHFYTISEDEKNNLIAQYAYVWTYEGIAFYAYPEGLQPSDAKPVYRFWSPRLSKHFYTISEQEKQNIVDQFSYTWTLEGVAWYAYE
jgi:hypothetical protein